MMLPATSLEKFGSVWIQCVIVVPILLYSTMFLGWFFYDWIGIKTAWVRWEDKTLLYHFFRDNYGHFAVQAIALWCVARGKGDIVRLGITILCILVAYYLYALHIHSFIMGCLPRGFYSLYVCLTTGFIMLLFWTLTYFRFRRTQL